MDEIKEKIKTKINNFVTFYQDLFQFLSENKKYVFSILFTSFLIISTIFGLNLANQKKLVLFKSQAAETPAKIISSKDTPKSKGYIIEFQEDSLSVLQNKSIEAGKTSSEIDSGKQDRISRHETAKKDVLSKINYSVSSGNKTKIIGDYTYVFNGIALDITEAEVNEIKKSSFVKAVYPNLEVKANLNESVPLIEANQFWAQKDSLGRNITGQGVKVAVLDTGIDYTHPDLGASKINERSFEQINKAPLESRYSPTGHVNLTLNENHLFAVNQGRLAYFIGNQIYLYSFVTKSTIQINAFSNDLEVLALALDNNILAYYGIAKTSNLVEVFYIDLTTNKQSKIANTNSSLVGSIGVTRGKIIYTKSTGGLSFFSYDTKSGLDTKIIPYRGIAQIWEGQVAYEVPSNIGCYKSIAIYNIETNQTQNIFPPYPGEVIDFKDNKILYLACGDSNWPTYYLYDIQSKNSLKLNYFSGISGTNLPTGNNYYAGVYYNINQGLIGNGVYFFSKYTGFLNIDKIVAYDQNSNKYVQINLLKNSGSIDGEGKKVCFVSDDLNIYCHDYNSNNLYPPLNNVISSKVSSGYNFILPNEIPLDDNGHGTHVAAIIAGNGILKGVAPDSNLIVYKVLDAAGDGYFSDIIKAINQIVGTRLDSDSGNDIHVISMSLGADCTGYFGEYIEECGPNDPVSRSVDNAVNTGITVVIAAGNNGPGDNTIGSPGTARKAITVGAVDKSKQIANFSSRGPVVYNGETIHKPDVVAPGVSICAAEWDSAWLNSRCIDNKHVALSGTSMATPHVAGLAALIKQKYPQWTPAQIKSAIIAGAGSLNLPIDTQGSGLINAWKIISLPNPTPTQLTVKIRAWGQPGGLPDNKGFPVIALFDQIGTQLKQISPTFTVTAQDKAGAQIFTYNLPAGYKFTSKPIVGFLSTASGDRADKKVYIDYITVNGVIYQTEDPRTYSLGAWDPNYTTVGCRGGGYYRVEGLGCTGSYFKYDQYGQPIATPTRLPTPTPTNTPTPTPTPIPSKRVFITSTAYGGNLGGLGGADSKCQERANAANLGGIWKAWLSDSSTSASLRQNHFGGPYKLLNGTIIAENWTDLTDGTLDSPINMTELKEYGGGFMWSNTNPDGSVRFYHSIETCNNYLEQNYNSYPGSGLGGTTDSRWTAHNPSYCNARMPLYCFEQ